MTQYPINVLHVTLNLERAGAQEVVRMLAAYQQQQGCSVTVCTLRDGPLRSAIEEGGSRVIILPRTPRIWWSPRFLSRPWHIGRELVKIIEQHHIQILQTHLLETLDFIALAVRWRTHLKGVLWTIQNVDFLPTTHTPWLTTVKRFLHRWAYRWLSRWVDGFIAVSDEVRTAILHQVGPVDAKIITIPNAIDVARFDIPEHHARLCAELNLPPTAYCWLSVGRLTEQKGHQYLIQAAPAILSQHPQTHFLFAGDGELRASLEAQVQATGQADHFHFLGIRADIPYLLRSADAFVLPSLWEGLSVALLEAMAAGRPVVATAVSGTTQVVTDPQVGLLVPARDSQALAQAMLKLMSDLAQALAMGKAARHHVLTHFSAQAQAQAYLAVYRRILGKESTGVEAA